MRTPDIHTLKILEEINKEELLSQRDIAKNLNVSLGLVNSFLKRLARKGYFKIVNIPKNRVIYILTSKGAAEKTRLTYQYIEYSYRFYKDARKKLKNLLAALAEQNIKRIAFYGATDFAEIAYLSLQETSIKLIAIFDEDKKGKDFFGLTIESMYRINDFIYDKLLYTDEKPVELFFQEIKINNISKDKIVLTSKG
ncbi:MAG: winged helix-turn-helix transcriptional regulator [Proteobacteria bacterium]|nr:winged helix-turn-helix transcriptional regulator [Pseudomonadota bacterium]